jgi:adenosylcobinamide kinase/adenosylcobinamide-phosphate guanylyltransferase
MRILLTGGSGCGKSTYAERLARELSAPRYYLATMRPYDAESRAKIARHQAQREHAGFVTIERETDVGGIDFPARGTVLLECMCNSWQTNV